MLNGKLPTSVSVRMIRKRGIPPVTLCFLGMFNVFVLGGGICLRDPLDKLQESCNRAS